MKSGADQINTTGKPDVVAEHYEIYFVSNRRILRTWNVSQTSNTMIVSEQLFLVVLKKLSEE